MALLVYVDDVILVGNNLSDILPVKTFLNDIFKIKYLGILKYFLGLEIAHSVKGINVFQREYILELLNTHEFLGSKPVHTNGSHINIPRIIHHTCPILHLIPLPWSIYLSHSHTSRYHLYRLTTQPIPGNFN